ncbi:hypothetical protein AB6N23_02660 [Cellulomonas sp. 179-A 9B4 NHS]|uniref:hypothetical protein n=1 Tax=Cellulomonas sp. 179-A 9B4 NHS TaxID=3142379 RepID=UPI0039A00321
MSDPEGPRWQWREQDPAYGNYGNANQWTVNAGLASLARESAQNTNDARLPDRAAELVYTFVRLTGEHRRAFEEALGWHDQLLPHVTSMGASSSGAVTAGQLAAGVEDLRTSDALVLLRISDHGARGLWGPEFADGPEGQFGNFVKLCRLDLFSGKDKAAGGSFGLGKAVYWRFSRVQTVVFNSTVLPEDGSDGRHRNRLFGVQQGVVHHVDGKAYQGRGYFGRQPADGTDVASVWEAEELARRLHVARPDDRPGTTALVVGFYDPDDPRTGLVGRNALTNLARTLRQGVEESFWPLLARRRMSVRIDVEENGVRTESTTVDPAETFTELVRGLHKYDAGEVAESLDDDEAVIVRDVVIDVPARRAPDAHPAFAHQAKLVVTLSDSQPDTLENRVCLFRRPEMIVETVDRVFEGRSYHAFLLAGAAVSPDAATDEQVRADDFLRFSEPPAHDRWIPGTGRKQASQANLTARYVAPWVPNLRSIETRVLEALQSVFGAPPPPSDSPPEAVLKHLRFLTGEPGTGGRGVPGARKPEVLDVAAAVVDGRWHVDFTVRASNRAQGWALKPRLAFVGLDAKAVAVQWDGPLEALQADGSVTEDGTVVLPQKDRARVVKARLRGRSVVGAPIPPRDARIDVVVRSVTGAGS